jgi:hypothetical protein
MDTLDFALGYLDGPVDVPTGNDGAAAFRHSGLADSDTRDELSKARCVLALSVGRCAGRVIVLVRLFQVRGGTFGAM